MRMISLGMLNPSMVLARSIRKGSSVYIEKGQRNIDRYVTQLKKLGITCLYIEDRASEGISVPDVVSHETRDMCKETLRSSIEGLRSKGVLDVPAIEDSVAPLMEQVFTNFDVQISLMDLSILDEYTFSHSVSTTVYALIIARELKYQKVQMKQLAMGCLLHDIGKTEIDDRVMFKKGKLTEQEFAYIKSHVSRGYGLLQNCNEITEQSRQVSLTHHEWLDGSGYPRGLKEEAIPEFGKIAAIADVYDALTADRCYRRRWSPEEAVAHMMTLSGRQFDSRLLQLFIQHIAVYPNGSMVELSDGRVGIVKEQNRSMSTRPVIRVIQEPDGKELVRFYEVDLMKELNLVIRKSQLEYME